MKKNKLREMEGDKIRWQYFTGPILILLFSALAFSYCIFIFELFTGNLDLSKWLSDALSGILLCVVLMIPFIVLYILNSLFFGKIICVMNHEGIHYKNGFVRWSDILKIEYEPQPPSRNGYHYSHAIIYTKEENIVLVHAPLLLLCKAKKYCPHIDAHVSKDAKSIIAFYTVVLIVAFPLIVLFKSE